MLLNHPKLFTDPKINYPINDLDLSFSEYIAECKQIITNTRIDLTPNTAEQIINANTPFELRPVGQTNKIKRGALLIHGLLDSPFHLRDIGLHLQKEGVLARSVLLPGHGTVPGALLHTHYHQWLQTVRYGIHSLAKEVDQVFLVGESTGASLALSMAARDGVDITGIIVISPALKIRSILSPLAGLHQPFAKIWPRTAWLHIAKNETKNYAKYKSIPFNAVQQVYTLSQEIKKNQSPSQPTCPIFFALSQDDQVICPHAIIRFFNQHKNPHSRLLLYANPKSNHFTDSRITVRSSFFPEMRIVNFSHIAIHISPDNPYYGKNGSYYDASHVDEKNNFTYGEFLRPDIQLNDLLLKLKLSRKQYQRLTFNPDFEFLKSAIHQFIKNIS